MIIQHIQDIAESIEKTSNYMSQKGHEISGRNQFTRNLFQEMIFRTNTLQEYSQTLLQLALGIQKAKQDFQNKRKESINNFNQQESIELNKIKDLESSIKFMKEQSSKNELKKSELLKQLKLFLDQNNEIDERSHYLQNYTEYSYYTIQNVSINNKINSLQKIYDNQSKQYQNVHNQLRNLQNHESNLKKIIKFSSLFNSMDKNQKELNSSTPNFLTGYSDLQSIAQNNEFINQTQSEIFKLRNEQDQHDENLFSLQIETNGYRSKANEHLYKIKNLDNQIKLIKSNIDSLRKHQFHTMNDTINSHQKELSILKFLHKYYNQKTDDFKVQLKKQQPELNNLPLELKNLKPILSSEKINEIHLINDQQSNLLQYLIFLQNAQNNAYKNRIEEEYQKIAVIQADYSRVKQDMTKFVHSANLSYPNIKNYHQTKYNDLNDFNSVLNQKKKNNDNLNTSKNEKLNKSLYKKTIEMNRFHLNEPDPQCRRKNLQLQIESLKRQIKQMQNHIEKHQSNIFEKYRLKKSIIEETGYYTFTGKPSPVEEYLKSNYNKLRLESYLKSLQIFYQYLIKGDLNLAEFNDTERKCKKELLIAYVCNYFSKC